MLSQVGIADTNVFKELNTDSKRDQDLGMMEQRLVITATASPDNLPVSPAVVAQPATLTAPIALHDKFPSVVTGTKLCASRDLAAGEVVEQYVGPVMKFSELPEEEVPSVMWVGPDRWLIPQGNTRYINHSCGMYHDEP